MHAPYNHVRSASALSAFKKGLVDNLSAKRQLSVAKLCTKWIFSLAKRDFLVANGRMAADFSSPALLSSFLQRASGRWRLAGRTVRICALRFGFTSTFCSSSLRRREPKRKEAHGDRLSFHPYAFYLLVKVLSLYNVASWKNASLTSTSEDVCHLATSSSSPRLYIRSIDDAQVLWYTGLSQRKFNGMLREVVPYVIKTAMEHLCIVCHEARSLRYVQTLASRPRKRDCDR